MKWRVVASKISGETTVPGDKSIAHRALMISGIAAGETRLSNVPDGADVRSTASCMADLGVEICVDGGDVLIQSGGELNAPHNTLDAGNSGTTMRLLSGILAGQPFTCHLTGDESLSRRPMDRIVDPLVRMGARIESSAGRPPLTIEGRPLHGISYRLPVDSAQVKSAVLLAGLFAEGDTTVIERVPTRDHTERMLCSAGVSVRREGSAATVRGGSRPLPLRAEIPGDPSSAAFLLAAAALTGGRVKVGGLCLNPTRTAFLDALQRMGAVVHVETAGSVLGEPVGAVEVSGSVSVPLEVDEDEVPSLVDELPLLALVATQVEGTTRVRGAQELRVKETDRIAAVADGLRDMGARINEEPDGFTVVGPTKLRGRQVRSWGDHRVAMMLAVAGAIAEGETVIDGVQSAAISFPGFMDVLRSLGGNIGDV